MIKINKEIEKKLRELNSNKVGSFFENLGAFTDYESEFILYYTDDDIYLAHISEFEISGLFIKLKDENKKRKR